MTQTSSLDMMIDIETLGQSSNAFIVQISARLFNPYVYNDKKEYQLLTLDINPWGVQEGSEIDNETVQWWQRQPQEIRDEVLKGKLTLREALELLHDFVKTHKPDRVWANSPSFDLVILENAFKRERVPNNLPKFWKWMDVRTINALLDDFGETYKMAKNVHESAQDTYNQCDAVRYFYSKFI